MRRDREPAQIVLDVMFEILSRCHAGEVPKDREDMMEWARDQLRKAGVDVQPMGLSHAVLKEKTQPDPVDEAMYFMFSDFEFLHSSQGDRMARVKRFLNIAGLKIVEK